MSWLSSIADGLSTFVGLGEGTTQLGRFLNSGSGTSGGSSLLPSLASGALSLWGQKGQLDLAKEQRADTKTQREFENTLALMQYQLALQKLAQDTGAAQIELAKKKSIGEALQNYANQVAESQKNALTVYAQTPNAYFKGAESFTTPAQSLALRASEPALRSIRGYGG